MAPKTSDSRRSNKANSNSSTKQHKRALSNSLATKSLYDRIAKPSRSKKTNANGSSSSHVTSISFKDYISNTRNSQNTNKTNSLKHSKDHKLKENALFLAIKNAQKPTNKASNKGQHVAKISSAVLGSRKNENPPQHQNQPKNTKQNKRPPTIEPTKSENSKLHGNGKANTQNQKQHQTTRKNTTAPALEKKKGPDADELLPLQSDIILQQQQSQKASLQVNSRGQFSIKNASLPPILVLYNLAGGTSTEDVHTVVQSLGTVQRCRTQVQRNGTVTAEVVFLDRNVAEMAAQQFDGAQADGQTIYAQVTKVQSIPDTEVYVSMPQSTAPSTTASVVTAATTAGHYGAHGITPGMHTGMVPPHHMGAMNPQLGPTPVSQTRTASLEDSMSSDMVVLRRTRPIRQ